MHQANQRCALFFSYFVPFRVLKLLFLAPISKSYLAFQSNSSCEWQRHTGITLRLSLDELLFITLCYGRPCNWSGKKVFLPLDLGSREWCRWDALLYSLQNVPGQFQVRFLVDLKINWNIFLTIFSFLLILMHKGYKIEVNKVRTVLKKIGRFVQNCMAFSE